MVFQPPRYCCQSTVNKGQSRVQYDNPTTMIVLPQSGSNIMVVGLSCCAQLGLLFTVDWQQYHGGWIHHDIATTVYSLQRAEPGAS
jgi:hypothetical protein